MESQQKMIEKFLPYLEHHGKAFSKFQQVKARPAREGEEIHTITADGNETINKASSDDFIVKNMTSAGEQYIIKGTTLHQKYKATGVNDGDWKIYQPSGKIIAVSISEEVLKQFEWESPFYFEAPWGEKMIVKMGDYLVSPLPDKNEIYRIARKEFSETYKIDH